MTPADQHFVEHEGSKTALPTGESLLGSGTDCAVRVQSDDVKAVHAAITVDGAQARIADRADGGTRVNGEYVHVTDLQAGDRLTVGEVELTLEGEGKDFHLHGAGRTFDLAVGENKIGRQPGHKVSIEHPSVSRDHASILIVPGRVRIRDLGATNGSTVNGRPLGEVDLTDGDKIQLGDKTELVYSASAPAVAPVVAEIKLVVDDEPRILKGGEYRIGRAPDCDIPLSDDQGVSRYHAVVTVTDGAATLRDQGSANGTRVNGELLMEEVTLEDGDRIGVGSRQIAVHISQGADPMGATVLASDLGSLADNTVLMSKDDVPPTPGPAPSSLTRPRSAPPPAPNAPIGGERGAAAELLGVSPDASPNEIRDRYQDLFSEFQVRLTNAPTPELKSTYENNLEELKSAFALLAPNLAADLPSVKPVPVKARSVAPVEAPADSAAPSTLPPPAPEAPAEPAAQPPPAAEQTPPKPPRKKREKRPKKPKAPGTGVPTSAIIMGVLGVIAAIAIFVAYTLSGSAAAVEAELQNERDDLESSIASMRQEIADSTKTLEDLQVDTEPLLVNGSMKICNLSARDLQVRFLAASYFEDNQLKIYRSSDTGKTWTIAPGGTEKFEIFAADRVVWDGSVLFFSALFEYRGQELWVTEPWNAVEGDCYPFAFDQ